MGTPSWPRRAQDLGQPSGRSISGRRGPARTRVGPQIGDIFLKEAVNLNIYVPYLVNYKNALTTLAGCQRSNADLRIFLERAHADPALRGLNIIGLLILPVQRIPR